MTNFASWGGSIGSVLALSLGQKIRDVPISGVSPHLHIVACGRGVRSEGTNERQFFEELAKEPSIPSVATSFEEFRRLADEQGFPVAAARG